MKLRVFLIFLAVLLTCLISVTEANAQSACEKDPASLTCEFTNLLVSCSGQDTMTCYTEPLIARCSAMPSDFQISCLETGTSVLKSASKVVRNKTARLSAKNSNSSNGTQFNGPRTSCKDDTEGGVCIFTMTYVDCVKQGQSLDTCYTPKVIDHCETKKRKVSCLEAGETVLSEAPEIQASYITQDPNSTGNWVSVSNETGAIVSLKATTFKETVRAPELQISCVNGATFVSLDFWTSLEESSNIITLGIDNTDSLRADWLLINGNKSAVQKSGSLATVDRLLHGTKVFAIARKTTGDFVVATFYLYGVNKATATIASQCGW